MTTPRARALVVSLMVSISLASLCTLSSAQAGPRAKGVHPGHLAFRGSGETDELRTKMLALVNRSREPRGLPALRIDDRLSREALAHSRKMSQAGVISHTSNLVEIISGVGGTVFGENVARGRGLQGIRDAWLGGSETRAILLDRRFHHVGLGVIHAGGYYWVTLQAFD